MYKKIFNFFLCLCVLFGACISVVLHWGHPTTRMYVGVTLFLYL